ncbi:MAG: hypothetical protein WBI09_06110 [Methanothrix sp.]|nr:hypothetical protein [Euryarchaeota archaeon]HRU75085.1 hypothetical protein [Methanothrix sp.]
MPGDMLQFALKGKSVRSGEEFEMATSASTDVIDAIIAALKRIANTWLNLHILINSLSSPILNMF